MQRPKFSGRSDMVSNLMFIPRDWLALDKRDSIGALGEDAVLGDGGQQLALPRLLQRAALVRDDLGAAVVGHHCERNRFLQLGHSGFVSESQLRDGIPHPIGPSDKLRYLEECYAENVHSKLWRRLIDHPLACHSVPPVSQLDLGQGDVDNALPRLRHPLHHGPVPLVNLPPPEQVGQPLVHILGFSLQSNGSHFGIHPG